MRSVFDSDPAAPNVTASRYRQVSVASVPSLSPEDLVARFTGREAYRHTRFVVARREGDPGACALVELARDGSDALFSEAPAARVLAAAEECAYVRDDGADPGIASHLARVAAGCPGRRCVIVEGRYRHINFLLNPEPLRITVVDVVPPSPSKLAEQVARVLDSAEELPPIVVSERIIDSRSLLPETALPLDGGLVVPCRGGGIDIEGVPVSYLDERPALAGSTLLGCERSQQIHRWFYGIDAERVIDWCPRRLLNSGTTAEGIDPAAAATTTGEATAAASAAAENIEPAATASTAAEAPDAVSAVAEGIEPAAVVPTAAEAAAATTAASTAAGADPGLVLSRCCMLDAGMERRGNTVMVPWGATLAEVRAALGMLSRSQDRYSQDRHSQGLDSQIQHSQDR